MLGWLRFCLAIAARGSLTVVATLWLMATVPVVLGLSSTTVLSGSMAPAVLVGDVVVVRPLVHEAPLPGSVVLVDDPDHGGRLRLHRLVATLSDGLQLRGDANAAPDSSLVAPGALHGVAVLRVPLVGWPPVWCRRGDVAPVLLTGLALAGLLVLAGPDRPAAARAPGRRRAGAVRAGAGGLVVLMIAASVVSSRSGSAAFESSSATAASFAADSFDCLLVRATPDVPVLRQASVSYPFAEPSGATTADQSGNGRTAALLGSVDRVPGSCRAGDGPALRLGASGPGAVVSTTAQNVPATYCVSLWFSTSTPSGLLAGLSSSADLAASGTVGRLALGPGGTLSLTVTGLLGTTSTATTPGGYADGSWHSVVACVGLLGATRIWMDGAVAAGALPNLALAGSTSRLRFGHDAAAGSAYYRGLIGTVAVWGGTVLSDADVAAVVALGR